MIMAPYLDYTGRNWIKLLPLLEFNINNSRNSSGFTPFEIDGVRIPMIPTAYVSTDYLRIMRTADRKSIIELQEALDYIATLVRNRLQRNQDIQAQMYDRNKTHIEFKAGDRVLLNTSGLDLTVIHGRPAKLAPKWIGPFTVKNKGPHPDTYELELLTTTFSALYPVFHIDVLRKYEDPQDSPYRRIVETPAPITIHGQPEYEPEQILAEKTVNRHRFYLVKWKNWSPFYNTWEPERHLRQTAVLRQWIGKK